MSAGAPLPAYTVRISRRARHVRLTVSARDGLVVVMPARSRIDPEAVVRSKSDWARRALAKVQSRRDELTAGAEALLPAFVELPGVGITGPVDYRVSASRSVSARLAGGVLVVAGDIDDADACLAAIQRWLARTASAALPQRVLELAEDHRLRPSSVRIGGARTRWGSCSARGTISLSRNSVFLPPHLLDALILHELAHLKVLDHSPRFWACLKDLDAEATRHRRELRDAEGFVPGWAAR